MPRHVASRLLLSFSTAALIASGALGQVEDPPAPAAGEGRADARAAAVAERVMEALGGRQAWDATRFIRFEFAGRRTHHWDKHTGRHRLEGRTQDDKAFVVLHDLVTREGRAWLDGQPVEGEEAKRLLERAYGAWINDTYWLLMPYKLRDPGVHLVYDGEEVLDGQTYDRLVLTFQGVGLTPGDRYWAYINRTTGLMDRWAYLLQDQPRDAAPTGWLWQGWQTYGRIKLAPTRQQVGGDRKLELGGIAVFDSLPDSVFTSPEPVAAPAP